MSVHATRPIDFSNEITLMACYTLPVDRIVSTMLLYSMVARECGRDTDLEFKFQMASCLEMKYVTFLFW